MNRTFNINDLYLDTEVKCLQENIEYTCININEVRRFSSNNAKKLASYNNYEIIRKAIGCQIINLIELLVKEFNEIIKKEFRIGDMVRILYNADIILRPIYRKLFDLSYLVSKPCKTKQYLDFFQYDKKEFKHKYPNLKGYNEWSGISHNDKRKDYFIPLLKKQFPEFSNSEEDLNEQFFREMNHINGITYGENVIGVLVPTFNKSIFDNIEIDLILRKRDFCGYIQKFYLISRMVLFLLAKNEDEDSITEYLMTDEEYKKIQYNYNKINTIYKKYNIILENFLA